MKITVNEKNTHVIADEGKLLYFVGDEHCQGFTEGFFPGVAKEENFVEVKIEIPEEIDLNNIIEK